MTDISYFMEKSDALYVSEIGHSVLDGKKTVGPYVRNTYLLHFVLSGVCHFSDFDAATGDAFLIAKNTLHGLTVDRGYEHIWFGFDGSEAEALLDALSIPKSTHSLLSVDRTLLEPLIRLYLPLIKNEKYGEETALSFLLSLMPLLTRKKRGFVRESAGDMRTAARFMETNLSEPIHMTRLASLVHLSEKHFCKKFKKAYGVPPRHYLARLRMRRAAELLSSTDMRVREVAASVGYPSQLNFSDAFLSHFGKRPSEFKKEKCKF